MRAPRRLQPPVCRLAACLSEQELGAMCIKAPRACYPPATRPLLSPLCRVAACLSEQELGAMCQKAPRACYPPAAMPAVPTRRLPVRARARNHVQKGSARLLRARSLPAAGVPPRRLPARARARSHVQKGSARLLPACCYARCAASPPACPSKSTEPCAKRLRALAAPASRCAEPCWGAGASFWGDMWVRRGLPRRYRWARGSSASASP